MQPQSPRKSAKAPAQRKPAPERSRLSAQTEATASREKVREAVAQVRAPRQTLRPVERTSKKK
jgi:hypothetical protein